jgi:hypothetical protein
MKIRGKTLGRPKRRRSTAAAFVGSVGAIGAAVAMVLAVVGSPVAGFQIDANKGVPAVANDLTTQSVQALYTDTADGADDWVKGAGSGTGLFQLGGTGTAAKDCYGSNIDFVSASLAENGGRYDSGFICDGNADSKFGTGGGAILAEPEQDIVSPSGKQVDTSWPIKPGSVTGKDDFSHAMLAISRDNTSPCTGGTAGKDGELYLAGLRGNNEGDAFWGFEFDQVKPDNFDNLKNHTGGSYNLVFHRTVGDILVSFTNTGSGTVLLEVFAWNGSTFVLKGPIAGCPSGTPQGNSLLTTNGEFPNPANASKPLPHEIVAPPWNTPVCDPSVTDGGGNSCRLASKTGGYPGTPKAYTAIPARLFMEAALDLHAFGLDNFCGNKVIFSSRSAHPLESADIKDVGATTLNVCRPKISITKTAAPTDICTGSSTNVLYTYDVKNTGNVGLTNIKVVDDNGTAATGDDVTVGTAATLAQGATVQFTHTFAVSATRTNIATVTADSEVGSVTATATATVTGHVCTIKLEKSAAPADVCTGSSTSVTYTYIVTNNSDKFNVSGSIVDDNGTPANTADDLTIAFGPIAPTKSQTVTATTTVTGTTTNKAVATGTFDDTAKSTATANASATVTGHVCTISLTKTPDKNQVCSGVSTTVTYTYVVKNTGDKFSVSGTLVDDNGTPGNTADDVTIGSWGPLAPGATQTLTKAFTLSGARTNIAKATGTFNDPASTVATTTATATVTEKACEQSLLAPTTTTCQQFVGGTAATENTVFYGVKSGQINNVSPGVLFYYTTFTAPTSGTLVVDLVQTHDALGNHASIPLFGVQSVSVFNSTCGTQAASITFPSAGVVRITISGVTAGQTFVANIKIDPGTVVGAPAPSPTTMNFKYATVIGSTTITSANGTLQKK